MDTYLIIVGIISLITFVLYAIDKHNARHRRRRISEKVLLGLAIFGGGVGGLLAMLILHHKTRHFYFWAINLMGIVLTVALPLLLQYVTDITNIEA